MVTGVFSGASLRRVTPEDIEQLKQLKQLLDDGVLTEEEFALQKSLILAPPQNPELANSEGQSGIFGQGFWSTDSIKTDPNFETSSGEDKYAVMRGLLASGALQAKDFSQETLSLIYGKQVDDSSTKEQNSRPVKETQGASTTRLVSDVDPIRQMHIRMNLPSPVTKTAASTSPRLFKSVWMRVIFIFLGLLAVSGATLLVRNGNSDEFSDIKPGAMLFGRVLAGEDLRGRNISGANLRQTDFTDSILDGVNFVGADLSGADLRNASLIGANLSGAVLDGAKFAGADLTGASLGGVEFHSALEGIKGVPTTTTTTTTVVTLPEGFSLSTPTTRPPRPPSQQATSPQTTPKPVYIRRTEIRVSGKTLPDGPWHCTRTYVYSDGKRIDERFTSPTKCSQ